MPDCVMPFLPTQDPTSHGLCLGPPAPRSTARLLSPSAMQILQHQLLGYSEFLTAIWNIKPRPHRDELCGVTQVLQRKL